MVAVVILVAVLVVHGSPCYSAHGGGGGTGGGSVAMLTLGDSLTVVV